MENVSGMVKGKMKLIFAEIMRKKKASGRSATACRRYFTCHLSERAYPKLKAFLEGCTLRD